MKRFSGKILTLFTAIVLTASSGTIPVFALESENHAQPANDIGIGGEATSGVTEPELIFEAKDPYDLDCVERCDEHILKSYNSSGLTAEEAYCYGNQFPADSAARMVYDALKQSWLGKNPESITQQVTVELGDKKIPMRTTESGVYSDSKYWDAQSKNNFELATQCAINAFLYDFPDVFWMKFGSGGVRYGASYQESGDGLSFRITAIKVTASLIDGASSSHAAVENKMNALSAQLAAGASGNAGRIKNAHDYIATNIEYGYTSILGGSHTRTPYGALFGDYIVCEGYARTFKLFCDKLSIPCVLVMGIAEPQRELHMWNAVKLDGRWYLVDVTWDDAGGGAVKDNYFLAGLDTVVSSVSGYDTPRKNHIPDGIINSAAFVFSYPVINDIAYSVQFAPVASNPGSGSSGSSGSVGKSSGGGGGGGGGSGGSGGGGGGSFGSIAVAAQNKPVDIQLDAAKTAVKEAVEAALAAGSGIANVRFENPGKVTLETLEEIVKSAGMPVKLSADSMSGDKKYVEVRIWLDPAKAKTGINLAASISDANAAKINARFGKWFSNTVQAVSLAQKTGFGQEAEFFVMLNAEMNSGNLKFYSFDGKSYSLMPNQKYFVDKVGYVRFSGDFSGDIIISDGGLVIK